MTCPCCKQGQIADAVNVEPPCDETQKAVNRTYPNGDDWRNADCPHENCNATNLVDGSKPVHTCYCCMLTFAVSI